MRPGKDSFTAGPSLTTKKLNPSSNYTETVSMREVTSFPKCLEKALSQPGQMEWEGVQDMVHVLNQEQASSSEVFKMLKQYLRSNSPTVILKALTIVDSLIINCGENIQERLLTEKWPNRISRLADHSDTRVKQAALQLISNYANFYRENRFGVVFNELAESISMKGHYLPSPSTTLHTINRETTLNTAMVERDFLRGMDFLQLQFPESSSSVANIDDDHDTYPEELLHTIQKINVDVDKLKDALIQCNEALKRFRSCECSRKDVLDQVNIGGVIAEKCNVWAENLRAFLIQDLREEDLSELLMTNDRLNETRRSWDNLVSMDILSGVPISDSEAEDYPTHETRFHSEGSTISECNEVKINSSTELTDRLRAENESLKLTLSNAHNKHKTTMLAAEAKFKDELKEVKSKAAWRIKELMGQIAEHELHNTLMRRETEDIQFKLKTADQALEQRSRESMEHEEGLKWGVDVSEELKEDLERALTQQIELETQLKQQSILVENLRLEIQSKEADLEAGQAKSRAEVAKSNDRMEDLARQLESSIRQAEETKLNSKLTEEYETMISNLRLEVKRESILRKKAYNHIRELKGNIRVIARVRPPMKEAQERDICVKIHDEYTIDLSVDAPGALGSHRSVGDVLRRYEFDACFGPLATQQQVYSETSPLIQSALDGFNVCVFCYGQTGSGKTHTLTGGGTSEGIVPLFMHDLFNSDTESEKTYISAYMLELYQEELLDLLSSAASKEKLGIRSDSDTGLVHVKGATILNATTSTELKDIFDEGLRRRKTATTLSNIESSRSHLIFTVLLERQNVITGTKIKSKITFVDLAGSERIVKSGAVNDKERLNEAKAINKSLSALGDVISALTAKESFIPYRNHKLTELMRDSLGRNAKTLMIVNISPLRSDAKETLNTLDYAQRVKQVTTTNSRSYETREIAQLKSVIHKQSAEIKLLKASSKSQAFPSSS